MASSERNQTRPQLPRGAMLLLAALLSFGAAQGISALAGETAGEEHSGGPQSGRTLLAAGRTPGDIGRWRLWYSTDAAGQACREVQLLDEDPAATLPASVRSTHGVPVPDGGSLAGGCGAPDFSAGSLTGVRETLVVGSVPRGTREVVVEARGQAAAHVPAIAGPPGAAADYFVARVAGTRHGEIKAHARDAGGRELGARSVEAPPAE